MANPPAYNDLESGQGTPLDELNTATSNNTQDRPPTTATRNNNNNQNQSQPPKKPRPGRIQAWYKSHRNFLRDFGIDASRAILGSVALVFIVAVLLMLILMIVWALEAIVVGMMGTAAEANVQLALLHKLEVTVEKLIVLQAAAEEEKKMKEGHSQEQEQEQGRKRDGGVKITSTEVEGEKDGIGSIDRLWSEVLGLPL
ncbi:hypothetical protein MW887_004154 [Aspergillus wentii]|nr:hypothetical protein MW887_004154 [Aspergillus wentii]